jgi:hypothetical protein
MIKTAAKHFGLLSIEEFLQKHEEFGVPPLNPVEDNTGIMKHHVYLREFIQGGYKWFYLGIVKTFKFRFTGA